MDKELIAILGTIAIVFMSIASCEAIRLHSHDEVKKACLEKYMPESCARL